MSESKTYCFINVLKEDHIDDYIEIHKNAWPEIMKAQKDVGVEEAYIWIYKNLAIIIYKCDDINRVYRELGEMEVLKNWNKAVAPFIDKSPSLSFSGNMDTLEKVFDLGQQIAEFNNNMK
jgi:L-rhamnose mutarotase